jgi:hypothetical protein
MIDQQNLLQHELKILVQEHVNYHFRHFWKNSSEVCEQKISINTQLW